MFRHPLFIFSVFATCIYLSSELESNSFDGRDEDLFDVDLIPIQDDGEEGQSVPYSPSRQMDQQQQPQSEQKFSDFDPSAIKADIIPFYEDDLPGENKQSLQNMEDSQDFVDQNPFDFDVVINQRLDENGEVIFEPVILGPAEKKMIATTPIPTVAPIETGEPKKGRVVRRRIIRRIYKKGSRPPDFEGEGYQVVKDWETVTI